MAHLVVMGVAGCGKSTVAALAAASLGLPLIEGDEFHAPEHLARMRAGQPLSDDDRVDWLNRLCYELASQPAGAVLACSALKRAYRERLRTAVPELRFVFLQLARDAALARLQERTGHFFPPELVVSQFDALETPLDEPGVLVLDATAPLAEIDIALVRWWNDGAPAAPG